MLSVVFRVLWISLQCLIRVGKHGVWQILGDVRWLGIVCHNPVIAIACTASDRRRSEVYQFSLFTSRSYSILDSP